ncbi:MAG TPA: hypothetical protein VIC85_03810 [Ktedonobacterales bacterium]|jgi:hypothetical protein
MATRSMSIQAATPQDLETMTMSYIAQGFSVANKTPTQVTLIKRKEFSVLWAVIGFLVCVLPLLIYLIIYASESDQMVVITLAGAQPASGTIPLLGGPQATSGGLPRTGAQPLTYVNAPRSPDGVYWWDGQAWQPVPQPPAGAQRSPDGLYWWDGQTWQPVPGANPTGPMGPLPSTGPMG